MPNFVTSAALVDTATKCLATAPVSPPTPASNHSRAVRALVIVSSVVKVFDDTMNSVASGSRSRTRFDEVRAVDVRDEPKREAAVAVVAQRLVRHDRPEIGTADPDVDDVADPFARGSGPCSTADAIGKVTHSVEHAVDVGDDVLAVDEDRRVTRCPQRDVEHGSLFRDVDLLALEHGVDAGAQTALFRESYEQRQGLVRDPVLRVVDVHARGLDRQPFTTFRILCEQVAEMYGANVPMV